MRVRVPCRDCVDADAVAVVRVHVQFECIHMQFTCRLYIRCTWLAKGHSRVSAGEWNGLMYGRVSGATSRSLQDGRSPKAGLGFLNTDAIRSQFLYYDTRRLMNRRFPSIASVLIPR